MIFIKSLVFVLLSTFSFAVVSGVSLEQRDALVTLYEATGGENWKSNENWLNGDPCLNSWYGIRCNKQDDEVTKILLYSNNLTGTIPKEIANIDSLTYISLGNNALTGTIPKELGDLSKLTYLKLYKNCLTGTIPVELSKLSKLKYLTLGGNKLTGSIPKELSELTKLTNLRLYTNQLTGSIPQEFEKLTKMEHLHLYRNSLTGELPEDVTKKMTKLKTLKLYRNDLSGFVPENIAKLSKLEYLYLERNNFSGILTEDIKDMESLKCLRVYKNENLTPETEELEDFLKDFPRCFTNVYYTPKCQCVDRSTLENLISNGSFEEFVVTKDNGSWKEGVLNNWEGEAEIWTNGLGKVATLGDYKIELDADKSVDTLSQNIDTVIGEEYEVALDVYARRDKSSDVEIYIDENKIGTINPTSEWKRYTFYFNSTNTSHTISLREKESQNDTYGAIIDNIVIIKHCQMLCN